MNILLTKGDDMARMIPLYSLSSQAEIEQRARELFEAAGRPDNRDLDLWLQAEAGYRKLISRNPECVVQPARAEANPQDECKRGSLSQEKQSREGILR